MNTFNQHLKSKGKKFKFSELVTEYQKWLQEQGFYPNWINAYEDVLESLHNIELAGIIWTVEN